MTLLNNHLEQISLSAAAIGELPFPPPKIFTNALLHSHDITALIRDTEAHERALFTLASPEPGPLSTAGGIPRRSTVHGLDHAGDGFTNGAGAHRIPRHNSAVAMILGGKLDEQIRKGATKDGKERGEVDVTVLLEGAEKLCGVYPIPGATEKIASLRSRYEQLTSSITRYESRVSKQTAQLAKMNRQKSFNGEDYDVEDGDPEEEDTVPSPVEEVQNTTEDLKREEEEIRELERKKRTLEDRVSGMERDLGGLLR